MRKSASIVSLQQPENRRDRCGGSGVWCGGFCRECERASLGFGGPLFVAFTVTYLLFSAAKRITGTTLVVDGGYTAG